MQKDENKLTELQIQAMCETGIITLRKGPSLDNNIEDFTKEFFLVTKDGLDYHVSKKMGDYLNSLIAERLEEIKRTAPMELEGEIETLFRYKALSKEDRILILKQMHAIEWKRFEENIIDKSWEISYLSDADYFNQAFQSAIQMNLEGIFHCLFFKSEVETPFGFIKRNWWEVINEELSPYEQRYAALSKIEFLKNELAKYSNVEQADNSDEATLTSVLALKQQILLLENLGFFEIPLVKQLTETQKGKVFGYLLNRNHKNTEDAIRYRNMNKNQVPKDSNFVRTEKNLNRVSEILKEVGLDKL